MNMLDTAKTLSKAIPGARLSTLDGQGPQCATRGAGTGLVELFASEEDGT
jgi:hypothetical protein